MREFSLYGGEVTGIFNPEARFRYTITDPIIGLDSKKLRGVTTVLGEILDKPGLRLWARDEMAQAIFGKFKGGKPIYDPFTALIKSGSAYSDTGLQDVLDKSFNSYQIKTERGKDIGTMTHDFAAQYLIDGLVPIAEDILEVYPEAPDEFVNCVIKAVMSFIRWWNLIEDKELLGVENIIYSRKYQFSGTYDLKCRINGKIYMLDIKTTNRSPYSPLGIYPEYFMQLGGYMQADSEESATEFDDCGIINVGKDGRLSIACASDLGLTVDDCKSSFIYAVHIHNWLSKLSKLTQDKGFKSHLQGVQSGTIK